MLSVKLKHSVITRLLKLVFGSYLIITVILTTLQMYTEYKLTENSIRQEIEKLPITYGPSLANALWTFNEESLHTLLIGMHEIPAVQGIKISYENEIRAIGRIIENDGSQSIYNAENKVMQADNTSLLNSLIPLSFPIFFTEENNKTFKIGAGTIYSSSKAVFERVKNGFILILINSFIKTLLLWLIFFYFIKKILAAPLQQLTDATQKIDISNLSSSKISINNKKHDELYLLEKSFNSMINSLAKSKKSLDEHQINLEDVVKERTKELIGEIEVRKEAQVIAENASKLKDAFMANVSHELRTPMTSIYGMACYLEATEKNSEKKSQLKVIKNNCERLISLINEILDFSKLKSDSTEINAQKFNLEKCVSSAVDILNILAQENNLEIKFTLNNTPTEIYGDDVKLHQVLVNLISNAIKFTPSGLIDVNVSILEGHNDYLLFSVKDTGIGIEKDKQDSIFKEFVQVDGSTSRKYAGTGLGLAIVKGYVDMMGGEIWIDSEKDIGSTFSFTLPITYQNSSGP